MEWQHEFVADQWTEVWLQQRPCSGLIMLGGDGTVGAAESRRDVLTAARQLNRCSDNLERELQLY